MSGWTVELKKNTYGEGFQKHTIHQGWNAYRYHWSIRQSTHQVTALGTHSQMQMHFLTELKLLSRNHGCKYSSKLSNTYPRETNLRTPIPIVTVQINPLQLNPPFPIYRSENKSKEKIHGTCDTLFMYWNPVSKEQLKFLLSTYKAHKETVVLSTSLINSPFYRMQKPYH